ncbi:MAG: hypothetical protein HY516_04185 [Candidatus Aenigmarchaeota archaeon]|nr:hypothetical protein [Candidatus Aenigmarchaeota archaeon]
MSRLKLFGKNSKNLAAGAVNAEKEIILEALSSFLDKENRINFDLNGVVVNLGRAKLKLNGSVDVTVTLPKRR